MRCSGMVVARRSVRPSWTRTRGAGVGEVEVAVGEQLLDPVDRDADRDGQQRGDAGERQRADAADPGPDQPEQRRAPRARWSTRAGWSPRTAGRWAPRAPAGRGPRRRWADDIRPVAGARHPAATSRWPHPWDRRRRSVPGRPRRCGRRARAGARAAPRPGPRSRKDRVRVESDPPADCTTTRASPSARASSGRDSSTACTRSRRTCRCWRKSTPWRSSTWPPPTRNRE